MQGASDILNHDELQTRDLFLVMVKQGDPNCLSDNRWSAVQCHGAKRDPSLASRKPVVAPPALEEKPVSAVAKAIKDAAAGALYTCHAAAAQSDAAVLLEAATNGKLSARTLPLRASDWHQATMLHIVTQHQGLMLPLV